MAISKLRRLKESKTSNPSQHLKNLIKYIFNPDKTEDGFWIGGNAGITESMCYENMIDLKQLYGKSTNGNRNCTQGYHYVLSFPPGETDESTVFEITEKFCRELLGDEYQYCFTLHNDQPHLHTHIVFNSVAFDGHMYHSPKNDWRERVQPILNTFCVDYGLSYIDTELEKEEEVELKRGVQYEKWNSEKKQISKIDILRMDLDKAIMEASDIAEFQNILRRNGYDIKQGYSRRDSKNYFTFINKNLTDDKGNPYRRRSNNRMLVDDYSYERILYRIGHKDKDFKVSRAREDAKSIEQWKPALQDVYRMTEVTVRRIYAQKIFLARFSGNKSFDAFPQAYKYQKDIVELDKIVEEYYYIHDHGIHSTDDIAELLGKTEEKIKLAKADKAGKPFDLKSLYREKRLLLRIEQNAEHFHGRIPEEREMDQEKLQDNQPIKKDGTRKLK